LTGETVMTFYIGVDFHPYQQTLCWCNADTGETGSLKLLHETEKVGEFYSTVPKPAIVGIEASSKAGWFEKVVEEAGHKLLVGNPVSIRKTALSRHKNDRIDAEHILWLLMRGEFPAIWRRPRESTEILDVLRLRSSLVSQRTQVYNRLGAIARDVGMPKSLMRAVAVQQVLKRVEMSETSSFCRDQLFSTLWHLKERVTELDSWLKRKAATDDKVQLLMTQKGVGYLTALTFVHTVGDITRFEKGARGVTRFAGYDPVERSSADRVRYGRISKAGPWLLRFHLGQAAQMAARSDAKLKAFYKRLAKKKPKAVAKTATARKLLVKLSIMLRDNISAEEFERRGKRTVGNARNIARSAMAAA
jgi:transposase